jgi:hypothetical protein
MESSTMSQPALTFHHIPEHKMYALGTTVHYMVITLDITVGTTKLHTQKLITISVTNVT